MNQKTALYDLHVAAGAKLVDFAGWDMPVQYSALIEEHEAVRSHAGMFDVSHMTAVDIRGPQTIPFLRKLLANDVASLAPGKAMYSCMLAEDAGIIDDLITYYMADDWFRTVVNAGTTDKDLAWIQKQAEGFDVRIEARRELCILAVQGPQARALVAAQFETGLAEQMLSLKPFSATDFGEAFVGRTGYTGEDGFEIILPADAAQRLWQQLLAAGVKPCGLGARDTLRLEAGMNLYGQDMDEFTHPLESGLGWTVAWEPADRDFIGRAALEKLRGQSPRKLVGLLLEGRGVLRAHQTVMSDAGEGEVTSGTFSPTMRQSIGLARVPADCGEQLNIDIRGKAVPARVVKYPFVRNGKVLV
ncbi:MAG: glycine cleavage system aminomethyltransferase GcvT [Nevskiales bacterium]